MTNTIHNIDTIPPSGKMTVRIVTKKKTKDTPEEYRIDIVHDPDATPWRMIDGIASRCVGHGVNK